MSLSKILPRRFALLAVVLVAAVAVSGCGGNSFAPLAGTLEVHNSAASFFGIDAVEISVPFGPVDHHDVFLAPGQSFVIDLQPDSYDIDLYWSDGSTESYTSYDINDGDYRVITGFN